MLFKIRLQGDLTVQLFIYFMRVHNYNFFWILFNIKVANIFINQCDTEIIIILGLLVFIYHLRRETIYKICIIKFNIIN